MICHSEFGDSYFYSSVANSEVKLIIFTLFQAIAIQQSLLSNPGVELNTKDFTDKLITKMSVIEKDDEGWVYQSIFKLKSENLWVSKQERLQLPIWNPTGYIFIFIPPYN